MHVRDSKEHGPIPLACWALGLFAALLATGCLDDLGTSAYELGEVRVVESDTRPTGATLDRGTSVSLPVVWENDARQRTPAAWYRARFNLAEAPTAPWAVYLPRFAQSAEVFANDQWVGSSGRVVPPLSRNWNRPLLLSIPVETLRVGTNTIDVHLAVQRTAPAFMNPFYVGPESLLGPAYRLRYFLQITCARTGAVVMAAIALVLGFIASRRSEFTPFRFFAAGCLSWAFASAELFIEAPPVAGRTWQLLTMASASLSIILFVQTTHRSFQKRRHRIEALLYLTAAALVILLATVPDRYFEASGLGLWSFCFFAGIYLGGLFMFGDRPPVPRARALMVLGFVGLLIGAHDVLLALGVAATPSVFLAPVLSLVAAFWGAWVVIEYFLGALREAETLNLELEERVASKHAELEANFHRLRELEHQRVVSTERERLMREMHDGMGGQLVSALAMAEDGETSTPEIAEVIRGALDDMRLVIDSLDPVIDDVPTLLGMIRGRVEPRLRAHGLRFDWRVTDLPPTPHFGPEQFLNVLRIAQEAITNIVKHANAKVIRVETAEATGAEGRRGICVSIDDDGRGLESAPSNVGRGLANMRVRAERLHGSVDVIRGEECGTTVRLWIPVDAPSSEA